MTVDSARAEMELPPTRSKMAPKHVESFGAMEPAQVQEGTADVPDDEKHSMLSEACCSAPPNDSTKLMEFQKRELQGDVIKSKTQKQVRTASAVLVVP